MKKFQQKWDKTQQTPENHGYKSFCEFVAKLQNAQHYTSTLLKQGEIFRQSDTEELRFQDSSPIKGRKARPFDLAFCFLLNGVSGETLDYRALFRHGEGSKHLFPRSTSQMSKWEKIGYSAEEAIGAWGNLYEVTKKILLLRNDDREAWRTVLRTPQLQRNMSYAETYKVIDPFKHIANDELEVMLRECDEHLAILRHLARHEDLSENISLTHNPDYNDLFKTITAHPPLLVFSFESRKDFDHLSISIPPPTSSTKNDTIVIHSQTTPYLLLESTHNNAGLLRTGKGSPLDKSKVKGRLARDIIHERILHYSQINLIDHQSSIQTACWIDWIPTICPWPPSIDSMHFFAALPKVEKALRTANLENAELIGDIGCGTGVLGISLAQKLKKTQTVFYSDNREAAPQLAVWNHNRNSWKIKKPRAVPLVGTAFSPFRAYQVRNNTALAGNKEEAPNATKLDVIVSCPPYIGTSTGVLEPLHAAIDTGLLLELASFPLFSKSLILLGSSLCTTEIEYIRREAERIVNITSNKNKPGRKVAMKSVSKRWVPFRVRHISTSSLEYLVKERGLIDLEINDKIRGTEQAGAIFPTDDRDFRYWHCLSIHIYYLY